MTEVASFAHLTKTFWSRRGFMQPQVAVHAVSDVCFSCRKGTTFGLVGESGCGKSTLARMAVGLLEPSAGDVRILGQSVYDRSVHQEYAAFRHDLCRHVQMIFQDPHSSMNPRMRIDESVGEPLRCLRPELGTAERHQMVEQILQRVGISKEQMRRYPHEFSGGQRQRIAIARSLIIHPAFVVCDEPTSSLDASVQAQVLNLLCDMQDELGLTYLFISHDLAVVRYMSDVVAVMYRGEIVEMAPTETLFSDARHPYTRLLLESVHGTLECAPERMQSGGAEKTERDTGCLFARRCSQCSPACFTTSPQLIAVDQQHEVRCLLA